MMNRRLLPAGSIVPVSFDKTVDPRRLREALEGFVAVSYNCACLRPAVPP